ITSYAWADRTAIPLPVGRPRSDFRIVAWSSGRSDSATATLRVGKSRWPVRVRVSDAARPDAPSPWVTLVVRQTRPDYSALSGQVVEAAREPVPVPDSSQPVAQAPRLRESSPSDPVTVPRARVQVVRPVGHGAPFAVGPGVEIFAPLDGTVLASNRAYVGVKGEPNAPVVLYD